MSSTKVKLVLRVNMALEHSIADVLLTYSEEMSFQIVAVKSYHSDSKGLMSTEDQVSGFHPEVFIQIDTELVCYREILDCLSEKLPNTQINYNVIPILASGTL